MKTLLVALHGIMTNQTDPSWPDKLDAWMFDRDPRVKVLKKEYRAGPFPHWNCWIKDPSLARSLANEIELFVTAPSHSSHASHSSQLPIWLVAHSNGAVIALLTAKLLIQRGYQIAGLILTGAACEADLAKNGVLQWLEEGKLAAAVAYSSPDDQVLSWGKLLLPYGSLGRSGWLLRGDRPFPMSISGPALDSRHQTQDCPLVQRWYPGGHSTYFTPENIDSTFEQIHQDIMATTTEEPGDPVPIKHILNADQSERLEVCSSLSSFPSVRSGT